MLDLLPKEINLYLFSLLSTQDLSYLARTSKYYNFFCSEETLWKLKFQDDFYNNVPKDANAKEFYKKIHHEKRMLIAYLMKQQLLKEYVNEKYFEEKSILLKKNVTDDPICIFHLLSGTIYFHSIDKDEINQLKEIYQIKLNDLLKKSFEKIDSEYKDNTFQDMMSVLAALCHINADGLLEIILQREPAWLNCCLSFKENEWTLLHHAIQYRRQTIIQNLIKRNVNLNQDYDVPYFRSALFTALSQIGSDDGDDMDLKYYQSMRQMIELLLTNGADPNFKFDIKRGPIVCEETILTISEKMQRLTRDQKRKELYNLIIHWKPLEKINDIEEIQHVSNKLRKY